MNDKLTLNDMVDIVFSHNEIVSIWEYEDRDHDKRVWNGMAWEIPSEYKDIKCVIFGVVSENIVTSDIINVRLIKESEE